MFPSLSVLAKTRRELDAAEAEWVRDVNEYDRSGEWRIDGYFSPSAALRDACLMTRGAAFAYVDLGRKLEKLPLVAAAFAAGDISRAHASVIAKAYTDKRAAQLSNLEAGFVEVAKQCNPHILAGVVRRYTDAIDGDGGADDDKDQVDRSELFVSDTLDGMTKIDGQCDALTGELLTAALDAEMRRDFQEDDPRTRRRRRMDALANICRRALDRKELGTAHGLQPHVSIVVHADELDAVSPETIDAARSERLHRGKLSKTMIELLLCDCRISRVIMNGESEILDVGREFRTVTSAQWLALVVRDEHCQAPGCDRPPSHRQAHHIVYWENYGPTDLENLQLLCWHHHRERHIDEAQARARTATEPNAVNRGQPVPLRSTDWPQNTDKRALIRASARDQAFCPYSDRQRLGAERLGTQFAGAKVVGTCGCGCPSIYFAHNAKVGGVEVVAEAAIDGTDDAVLLFVNSGETSTRWSTCG